MDLVVIGAGRAGGSLARAATAAGHRVVGMLTRRPQHDHPALDWDEPLPGCDLVLVAVSDGAITDVAERLAPRWNPETPAVHVSGFMPVSALAPIAARGAAVGSFHPLQTLPDPERGAAALAGAWAAVTAAEPLAGLLEELARSLGMRPFALADEAKPLYHAAAAAAANYVVEALGINEAEVTPDASFVEDLGADSLDVVELIMALEEEFDLKITDEEAERIATVRDAVIYISEQL